MSISALVPRRVIALLLLSIVTLGYFGFAQAQQKKAVVISVIPAHPHPGEHVLLSATSETLDLENAELTWKAAGKVVSEGSGMVFATVAIPSSGQSLDVTLEVDTGSSREEASLTIKPVLIDLLYESDSYTPPFFLGRALALSPARVRVQAIPYFRRGGSLIPIDQLDFTWRVNSTKVASVSGRGKSVALLPSPSLFATDRISVEVSADGGAYSDSASVQISAAQPLVTLHQDHPLFGVLYHQSLPSAFSLPGADASFAAVPYFAAVSMPDDIALRYVWSVNNKPVEGEVRDKMDLAQQQDAGSEFLVSLDITHTADYTYNATGKWNVSFSSSGYGPGGSIPDPFRGGQQ